MRYYNTANTPGAAGNLLAQAFPSNTFGYGYQNEPNTYQSFGQVSLPAGAFTPLRKQEFGPTTSKGGYNMEEPLQYVGYPTIQPMQQLPNPSKAFMQGRMDVNEFFRSAPSDIPAHLLPYINIPQTRLNLPTGPSPEMFAP